MKGVIAPAHQAHRSISQLMKRIVLTEKKYTLAAGGCRSRDQMSGVEEEEKEKEAKEEEEAMSTLLPSKVATLIILQDLNQK